MSQPDYLHGFSDEERDRLIEQAHYWRESLIPTGLSYLAGECVAELGCGVGAVLRVLADRFPGIRLAGIDLEPTQIAAARVHLEGLAADLHVGDAASLPWNDHAVDHVFTMWFLEHLADPRPVLREARRVLRAGGSIATTETDYTTFTVTPASPESTALLRAQCEYFRSHGDPEIGRKLEGLLAETGFADVVSHETRIHFSTRADAERFQLHIDYVTGFIEPAIPKLAEHSGTSEETLRRGLQQLRALPAVSDGAIGHRVYRVVGINV